VSGVWQHTTVDDDDNKDDEETPQSQAPVPPVPHDGQMFS